MIIFCTYFAIVSHAAAWAADINKNRRDVLIVLGWALAAAAVIAANRGLQ